MPRRRTKTTQYRDLTAARDIHIGDRYESADLTRVESLLAEIVRLLREPQTELRLERDPATREAAVLVAGLEGEARFARLDFERLGALQRLADPRRREEIYLARFVLWETYARWDRYYLPLAGSLLEAPLRLSDPTDQAISAAGLPLKDVRQALTDFKKTRLVILGDPGAGKTTTLERLALDLARERLRDPLNGRLPYRANLQKFTADQQPSDFLRAEWEASGLSETYGEAIAAGQVCFLLDGVNQMPKADLAKRIGRWADWANGELPPGNWAVFTCRTDDYVTDLRLPEVRVQSLDRARMRTYFDLRFSPERAAVLWRDFEQRLRAGDDRFERLARNPFMLAQLAERCEEGRPFTDSRAALMADLADRLLRRELTEARQPEALTADPRRTLAAATEALSRLAFAMQARGEGTALTRAAAARTPLSAKGQARLTLDEVLDLAADATVLESASSARGEPAFAFFHQLLQEYFAARELLRQFRAGRRLARYWRAPWRRWQFLPRPLRRGERVPPPPVTGWEEVVIMAAGLAGADAPSFIAGVAPGNLPLAGRCLAEAGLDRSDLQPLISRIRAELLARQRSPSAHLRARIGAGLALGEAGHPDLLPHRFQFESRAVWAVPPPLQPIPAGEFLRGSDPSDKRAYRDENTSERRVSLSAFRLGRYPVTNAEFKFFLEDDGYTTERWWSEAGWEWRQGGPAAHAEAIQDWLDLRALLQKQDLKQYAERRSWRPQEFRFWSEVTRLSDEQARERAALVFDRPFDRPAFWDDRTLGSPARPVVGVNWHEAQAYCRWLSAVTGSDFRLPTEAEWEKAGRGVDGREYPWGEKFASRLCNTVESHIYATTPVGLYAGGASPFGLYDCSGNVWEWTADWYQAYPGGDPDASDDFGEKYKAARGGSWDHGQMLARCAFRSRFAPDGFDNTLGFRVLSPGSISDF